MKTKTKDAKAAKKLLIARRIDRSRRALVRAIQAKVRQAMDRELERELVRMEAQLLGRR